MTKHPTPLLPYTAILPLNFLRAGSATSVPAPVRSIMERRLKISFGATRIHFGPEPSLLNARAFACGEHIWLSPDCAKLPYRQLARLLAHELTHVAQQRNGAVYHSRHGQVAVVRDAALEEEAEWHAERAEQQGFQPFATSAISREPVRLSSARPDRAGNYRIEATVGNRHAGSVWMHEFGRAAVELTDLRVLPAFRGLDVGTALVAAAARAALALHRAGVVLGSQDNGTGGLTSWYRKLGFTQTGWRDGYPRMKAAAADLANRLFGGTHRLPGQPLLAHFAPVLQCMNDEEARQRRAQRFAGQLSAMAAEMENRQATIDHLKAMVAALRDAIVTEGSIRVIATGHRARAHGHHDPADVFIYYLRHAAWNQIEAEWSLDGNRLIVTIRFGHKETVTGSYTRFSGLVEVFHCGQTATGVGYGTLLG